MSSLQIGDPIKVTVQKYDPSRDEAPYYKTYTVPYTREMRILEAIDYIVDELGESLAYQWFCGVKKCGMCGMRVNGRPTLTCWEGVEPEMVIEPLPQFPVIRDLVIDRDDYVKNLLALDPFIDRGNDPYSGFPEPLTSSQMEQAAKMAHCIECMLCVSVCPAYGPEFVGPAPLVQLARFALDPRDRADGRRAKTAMNVGGIANCVSCYECSQACPTNIPVLEWAIDGLRKQVIEHGIGDVAHHNRVYKDLTMEQGLVNPSTLMVRSLGLKVITEIPFAIRLWMRGRLSIGKILKGLLRQDKLETQDELTTLAQAVTGINWETDD